jgi:hypothetical protein
MITRVPRGRNAVARTTAPEQLAWTAAERLAAGLVTAGVVGAALWPFTQYRRPAEQRVDGFPLSYYPMFSIRREQYGHVPYVVGVRLDGSRYRLPAQVLGPGGVNQVRKQLSRAIKRGRVEQHAQRLAQRIAELAEHTDVTRVEIVRGRFDFDAYMLSGADAVAETVLGAADVVRPAKIVQVA